MSELRPLTDDSTGTCDWGSCDDESVGKVPAHDRAFADRCTGSNQPPPEVDG